jgi:hypothetical protein
MFTGAIALTDIVCCELCLGQKDGTRDSRLPTSGDKTLDDVYTLLVAITQRMPSKLKDLLATLETDLFGPAQKLAA